jgi:hypothetical protein
MRSVILLQSLAGSTFCHNAGTLLECDSVEAERLIEAGIARELLSGEPTELQKATKGRMVPEPVGASPGSPEPQVPPPEQPKRRRRS